MRLLAFLAAAVCLAQTSSGTAILRQSSKIDWKASGSLPPGAEYHLIQEDPSTHGVQTLVRFPSNYLLAPHSHTHDETILVLRGKLYLTVEGKESLLDSGSYALIPAGTVHAFRTAKWGSCEILAAVNGPFDLKLQEKQKP